MNSRKARAIRSLGSQLAAQNDVETYRILSSYQNIELCWNHLKMFNIGYICVMVSCHPYIEIEPNKCVRLPLIRTLNAIFSCF
jgi:hypothetical protein